MADELHFYSLPVVLMPPSGHRAGPIRRLALNLERGVQGIDRPEIRDILFQ